MAALASDWKQLFDAAFLRRLERLEIAWSGASGRGSGRAGPPRGLGDSLEFADHRAYTPGDEIRFVDWACYARSRRLWVRRFHRHADAPLAVLVDASASMGASAGCFDYARRLAAALAMVGARSGRRVLVGTYRARLDEPVRLGSSGAALARMMGSLHAAGPGGRADLWAAARDLRACCADGADTIVISDLLDSGNLDEALSCLVWRGARAALIQLYARGPHVRGPVRLVGAEGGAVDLDLTDEARRQCQRQLEARRRSLRRMCLARGADYVEASIDWPLERLMLGVLRPAGLLSG
jgi:uncharacterized protein (DUF58 family)